MLSISQLLAMLGMLVFGGITTNAQNDYLKFTTTSFPNYIGKLVAFNYPWFGNFLMFAAMSCVFVLWIYQDKKNPIEKQKVQKSFKMYLLSSPYIVLILSSIFDLIASGLMSVGLNLGVSASIYQMLNGSILIFTPILSFFCLKRKITKQQIIGGGICIAGLIIVALSSYFSEKYFKEEITTSTNSTTDLIIGMLLIVVAQVIYAGQFVVEEYTMQNLSINPAQVVTMEGLYGLILTLCFVIPVMDFAQIENDFDAFVFIEVEPMIWIPVSLFFFCVAVYNCYGQTVTKMISANHRTIVEGLRGLVVWALGLCEYYILGAPWGEKWNGWASIIELGGFAVLLVGSLIYYEIIRIFKKK